MAKYRLQENGVYDTETKEGIPDNPSNYQWVEYQKWLNEGNTPDPEFTQAELDQKAIDNEIGKLKFDLRNTDHWLFRMILEVWEVGITKGLWTNADITDLALKQKAADWKTKLDRLNQLGE